MIKFIFFIILLLFSGRSYAQGWERTTLETNNIKCVEHSPWGVLAGELSSNIWLDPPNAIFLSRDLGDTWENIGLEGRGIRDIKYYDGKIYAGTFYFQDGIRGLFVSENLGDTWTYIGPGYAPVKIDRDSSTLYFGTEHYGLWVSYDEGQTWHQRLGSGGDGTTIKTLKSSENLTLVSSTLGAFRSGNNGQTFEEIGFLSSKDIKHFFIGENVALANASYDEGLFASYDLGLNWEKISSFGNFAGGDITFLEDNYYVGRQTPDYHSTVYKSKDFGTWENTNLNVGQINRAADLTWVFSEPSYIFGAVINKGLYRYEVGKEENHVEPFLEIPWDSYNSDELISKITAFFDHSYPLLGYGIEPQQERDTTLNFYGEKKSEPELYYSSHSGTDYGLGYGTEIRASASGVATYFTCPGCGHSIKIDHLNGYETKYMHFQDDGLITKSGSVNVETGDTIGKIGMTGRTTGPHLHFEVTNGTLIPYSRVDPYGWLDKNADDPWPLFSGIDDSISYYIWNRNIPTISKLINNQTNIYFDNLKVETSETGNTLSLRKSHTPLVEDKFLQFLDGTSFNIDLFDQIGDKISNLENAIKITVSFGNSDISNIILDTIKLYFFDEILRTWTEIDTILDQNLLTATAQINHLSKFALFGEKLQKEVPETQILVSGSQSDGWFSDFPLISVYFNDGLEANIDTTFYSISVNDIWEIYTGPFLVEKSGFVNLKFRSLDIFGNLEDTKNTLLKINAGGKWTDKVTIKNSEFHVNF